MQNLKTLRVCSKRSLAVNSGTFAMKITEVTEFWFKSSLKLFVKSKSTSENIIYRIVAIVLIRKYNRLDLGQSRISVDRLSIVFHLGFLWHLHSYTLSLFHSTRWHSVYASLEAVDTKTIPFGTVPSLRIWLAMIQKKLYRQREGHLPYFNKRKSARLSAEFIAQLL